MSNHPTRLTTFAATRWGNRKLLVLGEAPGEEEIKEAAPFVGASGKFLRDGLFPDAELTLSDWTITNTINRRPPNNLFKEFTLSKTELKKAGLPVLGSPYGKRYLLPEIYHEAQATLSWIKAQRFDFILALGGTALWLLTGDNRIGLFRGTIIPQARGLPAMLATYHPAAVLREFKMRPIVWADLVKARRFLLGSLPPPLTRTFIYSPTPDEIEEAYQHFLSNPTSPVGVDIETAPSIEQITTISFAFADYAICIPIWDKYGTLAKHNVYPDAASETQAWRTIARFASLPNPKVLQNGLYDMQYLLEAPGQIRLRNAVDDTNILHHALQIELPKDLGTLASLYVNEPGWKQMRTKHAEEKAED